MLRLLGAPEEGAGDTDYLPHEASEAVTEECFAQELS